MDDPWMTLGRPMGELCKPTGDLWTTHGGPLGDPWAIDIYTDGRSMHCKPLGDPRVRAVNLWETHGFALKTFGRPMGDLRANYVNQREIHGRPMGDHWVTIG